MNRTILYSVSLLALICAAGCAKETSNSSGVSDKEYFDAWMLVHYPDLDPTPLGSYVIEETEGDGELVGDYEQSPYVFVNYVISTLDGEIQSTTSEAVAKQVGTYAEGNYYGPRAWSRIGNSLYAGVDEAISSMRVGGTKKIIIPGWLFTESRYDTPEEYVENVSGTNYIYDIEVTGVEDNIIKWQIDSIGRYLSHNFPGVSVTDSLRYGFYYIRTKEPTDTSAFPNDTTIFINYVAKRLDGQAFDTTVRDTARFYGIESGSVSYEPRQINWFGDGEDYRAITMGSSSPSTLIEGFSYALWKMRPNEAGTCIFFSNLGYSSSGSGEMIPGYSPLRFDIEIVDKEE